MGLRLKGVPGPGRSAARCPATPGGSPAPTRPHRLASSRPCPCAGSNRPPAARGGIGLIKLSFALVARQEGSLPPSCLLLGELRSEPDLASLVCMGAASKVVLGLAALGPPIHRQPQGQQLVGAVCANLALQAVFRPPLPPPPRRHFHTAQGHPPFEVSGDAVTESGSEVAGSDVDVRAEGVLLDAMCVCVHVCALG